MAFNRPGGNNPTGKKWNRGGSGRRKNYISIDFSNFAEYAEQLDRLNGDLQKIIGDAMEQAAQTVQDDTRDAVAAANLPAGGNYSRGDTEASIIDNPKVQWSGSLGEIGVGFDKSKPGAGGFLITGTPKMKPDYALQDIFNRKGYAKKINDQIREELQDALDDLGGGG